jgi:exosome complex RNA-binding protein Rrp42 (RNase PH superfamily)
MAGKINDHARFNGRSPTNYRPIKQQVSCQKAAGVSYSNQTEIAECIWTKGAPMRAKPRCGHGMSFSKKQEGQAANCFFEAAGSGNLAIQ